MMSGVLKVLLLLLTLVSIHSYVNISSLNRLLAIHDQYFEFPIIHIFHNDKFLSSPSFRDIQGVFKEAEIAYKDYSRFLMFNCQKMKYGQYYVCDDLIDRREIRKIVGFFPSSDFLNYNGRLLENPSFSLQYVHANDDFYLVEFEKLIEQIIPNFFVEIKSLDAYEELLRAREYPKLIFLTRSSQMPMVMKRIGVHFFLRFDLKFVAEQSSTILAKMGIKNLPRLAVVQYNYEKNEFEIFQYPKNDFTVKNFQNIKAFLEPFALRDRRTDLLMYELKEFKNREIKVVYNDIDATKFLDRAEGQVIVSSGKDSLKLQALREKYGKYFQYLQIYNENQAGRLQIYHPTYRKRVEMPDSEWKFSSLSHRKFVEGAALWMKLDYVVIRVREKYGHICAIESLSILRGLTSCLILNQAYYEHTSELTGYQFEIGHVSATNRTVSGQVQIFGRPFTSAEFDEVYSVVQSTVRLKTLEIVKQFKRQPFKPIHESGKIKEIGAISFKKSVFVFTNNGTNGPIFADLQATTLKYFNDYEFYQINTSCNKEIYEQIFGTQGQIGLFVYHAKKQGYVALKARLSKQSLDRFLDVNLRDNKKMSFHTFKNQDAMLRLCEGKDKKKESHMENDETL